MKNTYALAIASLLLSSCVTAGKVKDRKQLVINKHQDWLTACKQKIQKRLESEVFQPDSAEQRIVEQQVARKENEPIARINSGECSPYERLDALFSYPKCLTISEANMDNRPALDSLCKSIGDASISEIKESRNKSNQAKIQREAEENESKVRSAQITKYIDLGCRQFNFSQVRKVIKPRVYEVVFEMGRANTGRCQMWNSVDQYCARQEQRINFGTGILNVKSGDLGPKGNISVVHAKMKPNSSPASFTEDDSCTNVYNGK